MKQRLRQKLRQSRQHRKQQQRLSVRQRRRQEKRLHQAASAVTEEEAKKIALDDAGVSESNVTRIRTKREYDDGRELYSVEFYVDAEEYDYDIEISSGKIISKDFDIDDDFKAGSGGQSSQNDIISEDEAVAIVLERISGASADDVWIQLDRDDGKDIL